MLSFVKVMVGMAGFQPTWMVSLLIYSQPPSSTRPHTHNIHIKSGGGDGVEPPEPCGDGLKMDTEGAEPPMLLVRERIYSPLPHNRQ